MLVRREKARYGKALESARSLFLRSWLWGLGAGLLFSLLFSWWSWHVRTADLLWLWGCMILFSLFGIRLACFSYAAGVMTLAALAARHVSALPVPWETGLDSLRTFSGTGWLLLAGWLHLAEWALIRLDGARGAQPVEAMHQNGWKVNGFLLTKGWPVPLILHNGFSWIPIPLFLSFGRLNLAKPVRQQKRLASTLLFLYGAGLCLLAGWASVWPGALWVVALFAVCGHEAVYLWGAWLEKRKTPLFVSDDKGLKVLAVLPGSPAEAMGLKTGDILQRVNGQRIFTVADLEKATQNASFVKCEVLDEHLDKHLTQKALYEDDPRHLGVIGAIPYRPHQEEKVEEFQTGSGG
jgi:hypothetical protein